MTGTNVLVAYPYATPPVVERLANLSAMGANVYIDSGAFSAWNAGKVIHLDQYAAWLRSLPFRPTGYFQLDVVGDREATLTNLRKMLDSGFKPIGVFQRGMPESDIDDLFGMVDVVGVGGLGGSQNKAGYCKWFLERAAGRKVHLLGHVSTPTIAATRPWSCDSTNWSFGSRGLAVMVYAGRGVRHGFHRGQYRKNAIPAETLETLKTYGITTRQMRRETFWSHEMLVLGARSLIRTSTESERLYNCKIYAACCSTSDLDVVKEAWQREGAHKRSDCQTLEVECLK